MSQILEFTLQTILGELLIVTLGVLFAAFVKSGYDQWRYGGWRVLVTQNGQEEVNRPVSARKAEQVLEEPADLAVYLKGVASPYAWIRCDIISEGKEIGLLTIDKAARRFIINLDRNPAEKAAT